MAFPIPRLAPVTKAMDPSIFMAALSDSKFRMTGII